jgi:hypothetical protein
VSAEFALGVLDGVSMVASIRLHFPSLTMVVNQKVEKFENALPVA